MNVTDAPENVFSKVFFLKAEENLYNWSGITLISNRIPINFSVKAVSIQRKFVLGANVPHFSP